MTPPLPLIAVVDDDLLLLESLENLLESANMQALVFPSAMALLDSEALPRIDCLIVDISMPGMDGIELRDRLKVLRPELPLILITWRHEIAEHLRQHPPAEPFFRKPFDGRLLLDAIARLVGNPSSKA